MGDIYIQSALKSFNVEVNPVLQLFFSDTNIDMLQRQLVSGVRQRIGQSIDRQSCDEIFVVMKFVYLQVNRVSVENIREEVAKLNGLVLNELVPMVSSNVLQYKQYMKDISTLPRPIDRGQVTSTKGENTFVMNSF